MLLYKMLLEDYFGRKISSLKKKSLGKNSLQLLEKC